MPVRKGAKVGRRIVQPTPVKRPEMPEVIVEPVEVVEDVVEVAQDVIVEPAGLNIEIHNVEPASKAVPCPEAEIYTEYSDDIPKKLTQVSPFIHHEEILFRNDDAYTAEMIASRIMASVARGCSEIKGLGIRAEGLTPEFKPTNRIVVDIRIVE